MHFFGHRDAPQKIEEKLRCTLIHLIENHNVKTFYVGNQGGFDAMVIRVLQALADKYDITYNIVFAYVPGKKKEHDTKDYSNSFLPDGIEVVPKRFAITYRNKWMIKQSEYVVTHVTYQIGSGAAQFKKLAEKQHKCVINVY